MPPRRRSADTISAMLGSAPKLSPVDDEVPKKPRDQQTAPMAEPAPAAGGERAPEPAGEEYDETDLDAFEFDADAPLVARPRRRKEVDYQTLRINRPTARIMRAQWLAARQVDVLLTYTEFATMVVQEGLQAMNEKRRRGSGE